MKKFAIVLAGTVMLAACGGEKDKSADVELKSEDQKASYALGFRSAEQMSAMENLDLDAMVAGLRDGFGDEPESRLDRRVRPGLRKPKHIKCTCGPRPNHLGQCEPGT